MCTDSHEFIGDEEPQATSDNESDNESNDDNAMETEDTPPNGGGPSSSTTEYEYNPLIVRRSNRAIKPTKDIDLYLLGAQFGVDLEGSEVDSSDPEFSPKGDQGSTCPE